MGTGTTQLPTTVLTLLHGCYPALGRRLSTTGQGHPGTTYSWDVVDGEDNGLGHFLAQASDLPPDGDQADQDDAYQVISSNTARGPDKQFRVHLLTFWANPMGYGKCTRCFAKGDLPQSWFVSRHGSVEGKDIPDLEVDTGSDTDDSVDTQSEADAVPLPLPKVLPVESWGDTRSTPRPACILRKWRVCQADLRTG